MQIFLQLLIILKITFRAVSEDKIEVSNRNKDNSDNTRRLFDSYEDYWQIANLKATGETKAECYDKNGERKINDGAYVMFVSAQGLTGKDPCDEQEKYINKVNTTVNFHKTNTTKIAKEIMKIEDAKTVKYKLLANKTSDKVAATTNTQTLIDTYTTTVNTEKANVDTKISDVHKTTQQSKTSTKASVATTVATNATSTKDSKGAENVRRSEYMFSSVEYYDDVLDFDESTCPDAVEVVNLEMDALKNFDPECEMMMHWESLI